MLALVLVFFCSLFLGHANATVCKQPTEADKSKSTFCFFSLNNPKEKTKFEELYSDISNVEVKEFYGSDNKGKIG